MTTPTERRSDFSFWLWCWVIAFCAGCLLGFAIPCPAQTPPPLPLVGNVFPVDDWQTAIPWVDLARSFRQWGSTDKTWESPIPPEQWNAYGYPVVNFTGFAQYRGPAVECKYQFEGAGDLTFIAGTTVQRVTGPHSGTVGIVGNSKALQFRVTGVNAGDPFRNLTIRPTSAPAGAVFNDAFLEQFRPFTALRFMDWARINSVLPHDWAHRVLPGDLQTLPTRGVCWEYQIDLCNATGCAYWLPVPHWITDDYARQLAALIKQRLKPGLPVYLEYSNEIWNGIFPQCRATLTAAGIDVRLLDANNRVGAAANADPALKLPADGDASDPWALQYRYSARRTVDLARIFRQELGAGIVRPLLMGQAVIDWRVGNGLKYLKAVNRLGELFGIGYAGYHAATPAAELAANPTAESLLASMLDDVTRDARADKSQPDSERARGGLGWIRSYKTLADAYGGLKVLTYEGGPAFSDTVYDAAGGMHAGVNSALHRALQADKRLGDVMVIAGRQFQTEGGYMYAHFSSVGEWYPQFGWWAIAETYDRNPKFDALMTLAGLTKAPPTPPPPPPTTKATTVPTTQPGDLAYRLNVLEASYGNLEARVDVLEGKLTAAGAVLLPATRPSK